jgi:uncharacterized membrane protein
MSQENQPYEDLQRKVAALTERVYRLEQLVTSRNSLSQARTASKPVAEVDPPPDFSPGEKPSKGLQGELESRIGGHWLNRVGILTVLIGAAYFLKYAFDNAWVGPAGRVLVGLLCGCGIVVWSEFVRRSGYELFSYSLKAVGIGVLYLSLWASSQVYGLVPNVLAFFAMASVTAATIAIALWQNTEVVAAFAALGGFITPVALSTGENQAVSLFAYITILDIGALLLSRYRPWIRVLLGSYAGTFALYGAWHARFYTPDQFWTAMISISVLFAIFFVAPVVIGRDNHQGIAIALVLVNAAVYFFETFELFDHSGISRQASPLAVALGGAYFLMARQFLRGAPAANVQIHWSIGIALLIVAVPIGLDAQWITIVWLFEGGALLWIRHRTQSDYLKYLGVIALALGVARLVVIDRFEVHHLVFNERMATFAVAIAVLAFTAHTMAWSGTKDERNMVAIFIITLNVLALLAFNHEIADAWRRQAQQTDAATLKSLGIIRDFAYSALWMVYGAGLMIVGFWKASRFLRWQALILIGITVGKVFLYDISSLDRGYRILCLIALGLLLLTTSFLYQRDWLRWKKG